MNKQLVLILIFSAFYANGLHATEKKKSPDANSANIPMVSVEDNTSRVKKEELQEKILSELPLGKKSSHIKKNLTPKNMSDKKNPVTHLMVQKTVVPSIKVELENIKKITSSKADDVSKKSPVFENPFEKKPSSKYSSHPGIPSKSVLLNQETLGSKFSGSEPNAGRNRPPLTASNVSQF